MKLKKKGGAPMREIHALLRRCGFWRLTAGWFVFALLFGIANEFTLRLPLLDDMVQALYGILLLLFPIWPEPLGWRYEEAHCRRIIRIIAVCEIVLSFLVSGAA